MADDTDVADVTDDGVDAPESDQVELTEVENLASEMGWHPKDEWKGSPDAWKPAADFLKATRDINKALRSDLNRMGKQLEGISRTTASMTERAIAEERTKWEAELDRAVDDGDKAAVKTANKHLADLDRAPVSPTGSPEGEDFATKHGAWFGKDDEATKYAVNRAQYYADQGVSGARQLAAVEKDMKGVFPELFETPEPKPQRQQPAVGEPARVARTSPREKGYATLTPVERKACDTWVADNKHRGAWATKETWATNYYGTEEAANG